MSTKRKQNKPQKLFDINNQKIEIALSTKINNNNIKRNIDKFQIDKISHLDTNLFIDNYNKEMSNDQENFLKYINTNPHQNMSNLDDFYKIFDFLKYYYLNNTINPLKNDYSNLFNLPFYQAQYLGSKEMFLANIASPYFSNQITSEISPNSTISNSQKKSNLNSTDLLKQSIDKIFSSSENKPVLKRKMSCEDIQCSCGMLFDSFDAYTIHLKQSNHRVNNNNCHKRLATSPQESSQNTITNSQKMVRGQEEWVNNSRHNNFISQILKCLECSESFETLTDLSLHMAKSNHFSKFHPNQSIFNSTALNSNMNKAKQLNLSINNSMQKPAFTTSCKQNQKLTNEDLLKLNTKFSNSATATANIVPSNSSSTLNKTVNHQHKFICKICLKNFPNENTQLPPLIELIQHLKKEHSKNHICTNCGDFYETIKDLSDHLLMHHNYNQISVNNNQQQYHNNHPMNKAKNLNDYQNHQFKKIKLDINNCNNNGINNNNQKKQCNNLLDSSISPSSLSSNSSSSSSSNNSSPSYFLYENKDKLGNNHPLLALQMFVNGNSKFNEPPIIGNKIHQSPQVSPREHQPVSPSSTKEVQTISKLPAKKRPYFLDENEERNEVNAAKNNNGNTVSDLELKSNETNLTQSTTSNVQPLHLLQNMNMKIDEYFAR